MFAAPNLPKGKKIEAPVEMLSIYPTLLELSGLKAYDKNEGTSLVSLMKSDKINKKNYAITTFGKDNHAIKKDGFRYIQYEDKTEEFYDHNKDPNEWTNQANNPIYASKIAELKKLLPTKNVKWDEKSNYTFQPYFVNQKKRVNGGRAKPEKK